MWGCSGCLSGPGLKDGAAVPGILCGKWGACVVFGDDCAFAHSCVEHRKCYKKDDLWGHYSSEVSLVFQASSGMFLIQPVPESYLYLYRNSCCIYWYPKCRWLNSKTPFQQVMSNHEWSLIPSNPLMSGKGSAWLWRVCSGSHVVCQWLRCPHALVVWLRGHLIYMKVELKAARSILR